MMTTGTDGPPTRQAALRRRRFQFQLWHLFALMTWLAIVLSSVFAWNDRVAIVALIVALLVVFLVVRKLRAWAVATIVSVVLVVHVMGGLDSLWLAANRRECPRRLKLIGLALHNYHNDFGCFPPPEVLGSDGKPLCSWRVLILPYLQHGQLYRQWRLDESWDSPHNRPLADRVVDEFQCPFACRARGSPAQPVADYLAVVGPGMGWERGHCLTVGDFTDGTSNTVMVVEVRDSQTHWAQPGDLERDAMSLTVGDTTQPSIANRHPREKLGNSARVMLADGSVHFWSDQRPREHIEPMLTRDGGEPVDPAWFQ